MEQTTQISPADIARQLEFCQKAAALSARRPQQPLALVDTYGCQQNEADSERLRGFLAAMGFGFTQNEEEAQIIVLNTCAIREHAEQRVFGNVGALVHVKRRHPDTLICLCGCMVQQPHAAEKLRTSFRHVDLVFGPQALWRFPEMVYTLLTQQGRIFSVEDEAGSITEGIPVVRQDRGEAWVSIMYGCNNFCSYCIVPYVRGRERSRRQPDILAEVRQLVQAGYRDITLLGQNVNSYGKDLPEPTDFSALLEAVNAIPGDFLIRFMTSHPKDATLRLFQTMARCEKVAPVLHLPFQAGNDRILKAMNRRHTRAQYLEKIQALRDLIPDIVLTSDVIVGFPGETTREFEDTLAVLEAVRFDALFTFLYSPREGTPAARMDDPMPREEKLQNFNRLTALQDRISEEKHAAYVGKTLRCLVDGASGDLRWPLDDPHYHELTARTPGNRLVRTTGPETAVGQFRDIHITGANKWSLFGTLV
ncbi:MAG: tRNA (N6-isopentenyl adenosine(37)-C2)-methylthiotransferase MiaB [Lawsonibacter sp.]|nr:tRNA (N6-isopentenyl adenosine(37)-C2)-methylthiotransferase MiaB [Lawsonibacter sp.]